MEAIVRIGSSITRVIEHDLRKSSKSEGECFHGKNDFLVEDVETNVCARRLLS